jgi:exosortase/archaeosortase family protein
LSPVWRTRAAIVEGTVMSLAYSVPCRPVSITAAGWLAIHAVALWPHGEWAARRVADGSDDPLGLAALAVLLLWLWHARASLRATPRLTWLGAAAVLTVAATAALFVAPPLAAALLAALAIGAHAVAWMPERSPRAALTGLTLLALPLIASLQFYAGYPLRVFTAQFSAWLLQAVGMAAERSGAAMTVNAQLVIVDAPCSGVQMAWLAYFAACSVALFTRRRDGAFLRRLPLVSLLVLAGNVLRNTTLVALEARPQSLAPWAHEAVGIVWLVLVVGLAVRLMTPRGSLK